MTKLLIEVPDNLHRFVKTLTSSKGETMKNFVLRAMATLAKEEHKIDDESFISEEAAQKVLEPYLINLVSEINNGKETVIDSQTFFNQIK